MYTIEQLRDVIKTELDKQEYVEEPYSLFEPIKYIMEDGGKRLRPVLTLMAYNLYRDDIEKALRSAVGIEIFHNSGSVPKTTNRYKNETNRLYRCRSLWLLRF